MRLWKIQNGHKTNEIVMINNNSYTKLLVRYSNNGDLCFSIGNGIRLKKDENDIRIFDIINTDKDVYEVFDKFYNSLLSLKDENQELFDRDDNFVWFSNGEKSDYLVISHNLEGYRLSFVRNNSYKDLDTKEKTIRSININFYASEIKNNDIMKCFYEMYKGLNKIGVSELLFTRGKDDKNE